MLRRCLALLETGTVAQWNTAKGFGFVNIGGDENNRLFVHNSSIIQARNQRPVSSIRRGVEIQFDVVKDDQGRQTARNVTTVGGQTLSSREEVPATRINVHSLRDKLVESGDNSRHNRALTSIVESIATINKTQQRIDSVNRSILSILNAICDKEGVVKITTGDELKVAKEKVMKNILSEVAANKEKRRAAIAAKKGIDINAVADEDLEDDHDDDKKEDAVEEKKKGGESAAAAAATEHHSAEDLLDLMEDESKPKGKGKKGKGKKE